eukprot:862586_1
MACLTGDVSAYRLEIERSNVLNNLPMSIHSDLMIYVEQYLQRELNYEFPLNTKSYPYDHYACSASELVAVLYDSSATKYTIGGGSELIDFDGSSWN